MSSISKATQTGYQIGQQNYRVSGDKKLRELRNDFICLSLDSHGLIQSNATINAFRDGYKSGWKAEERKAA
jgi:hypothetical protein